MQVTKVILQATLHCQVFHLFTKPYHEDVGEGQDDITLQGVCG